jgi:hypothetical protein
VADGLNTEKKNGLTRGKAILIAVLAVVLVAILYIQFGPSGGDGSTATVEYHPPGPPAGAKPAPASVSTSPASPAVTPAVAISPKAIPGKDAATVPIIDETRWKAPAVNAVVSYDPFALPPTFPQAGRKSQDPKFAGPDALIQEAAANDAKRLAEAIDKLRLQLKELEARGVHVILRDGDEYVAMIDDQVLHVGDVINGFTVTAIDPKNGVYVERKQSP